MTSTYDPDLPTYEEAQLQAQLNNHPQDNSQRLSENPPALPRRTNTRRRPPPLPERPIETSSSSEQLDDNKESDNSDSLQTGDQPFWKFHIQCFGDDMYLSTNPTMRHLQCRSMPGYFMSIEKEPQGFTINLEEFETGASIMRFKKLDEKTFKFKVRRSRKVENGEIVVLETPDPVFEGTINKTRIHPMFFPIPPPYEMKSYEVEGIDGSRWDVGSIPRAKMKWSLSHRSEAPKYVGKRNVYFHRNFMARNTKMQDAQFPPVTAAFRPCESKMRKRAIRSITRLSKLEDDSKSTPYEAEGDPFSQRKPYFKCGDGLYDEQFPKDDDPDHHFKLGWLTVFEDEQLFSKSGMFDLVVGSTVVVAYDQEMHK
ncbi:hypothetical protein ACI3LY_001734 [Candidozyma auris]|uniref:Uncharacterized protein n=2 Tax=Candidozyma auris TaxID=498019 RepID=A0A2H0ZYI8_CANAR|nr:hypothetical_protein [[Candida] auris]PIS52821.1 hypothetical protein CJI97_002473 [[Candida] auris]PIS55707.1 hypothetical protein B9J08_001812 [[Candida] auris]QEO19495.1 hypothetical_protein [[Candida] auris]QWW22667.1 hypothetical protein CA7LBN_001413 [[Candida] auris]GBL50523.1 hypothetical protein CAJCM15448_27970 [[Candida] auris]